jgi:ATP-dependent Zn protease
MTDMSNEPKELEKKEVKEGRKAPTVKKDGKQKDQKKTPIESIKEVSKNVPLGPGNFWNNILSTVLLLVLVTAVYSYVIEHQQKPDEITVSDIAGQVKNNEVAKLVVRGTTLEVEYKDTTKKKAVAKKERDAAVTDFECSWGKRRATLRNPY